jgi:hypothetical protein
VSLDQTLTILAPGATACVVRGLARTWRITVSGVDRVEGCWRAGQPLIYTAWHGQILALPWAHAWLRRTRGARAATVLVSRSRDGERMSRFARRFGLAVVRGSSSRGGVGALRALARILGQGGDVVVVPDGPRGPARQVRRGVVALAARTRTPVVPVAFAARPAWRLSSWDRFLVPLPFARCALAFGAPLRVEHHGDLALAQKELARALDETTTVAEGLVGA